MCQPFKTTMERYKHTENLRQTKQLTSEFCRRYIKQSDLIIRLIDDDQEKRPSASSIVKEIPNKSRPSKTVRGFGAHLARVSMENGKLIEERVQMKDKIKLLEQRVAELEKENRTLREVQSKYTFVQ